MSRSFTLAVLSDIHYAGATERTAGDDYETRVIENPILRFALRKYRDLVWLRYPLRHNDKLDRFIAECPPVDYVVANGDYAANVAALGLCDDAAAESARECLGKLRAKFGGKLLCNYGDHELGKLRMLGSRGGLRIASWRRCTGELGLQPFWCIELGNYVLMNCVSTLVALPVFGPDMLAEEKAGWENLRSQHLDEIRSAFAALRPSQRVLLFCHDPTALPFLWRDEFIRPRLAQVEQTIIGHLHSNLCLRTSRILSGMPVIPWLGHSAHRMTTALREARIWKHFRVRLCPSLAGIQLLKDGGFFVLRLNDEPTQPAEFQFHHIRW